MTGLLLEVAKRLECCGCGGRTEQPRAPWAGEWVRAGGSIVQPVSVMQASGRLASFSTLLSRHSSSRLFSRIEPPDYFRLPYLPLLPLSLLSPAINVCFIYSRLHPTAPKSPNSRVAQQSRAACKDNFQLKRTICYNS